jgi:hypothetical protein
VLGAAIGVVAAAVVLVALLGQPGSGGPSPATPPRAEKPAKPGPPSSPQGTTPSAVPKSRVPLWPPDEQAYTVVLLSTTSQTAAEDRVLPLVGHGADVGILRSDDYEGFRPGSWVVWRGRYQRLFKAEEALTLLRESGRSGEIKYVRRRGQAPASGGPSD